LEKVRPEYYILKSQGLNNLQAFSEDNSAVLKLGYS